MAHRFSSSDASSSLRQSLGMPLRNTMAAVPADTWQQRPPSQNTGARRKTYVTAPSRPSNQSRQTLGASRPSTGRSSMYGTGSGIIKKDTRPLSDKAYQIETIKKLVKFLGESNYPGKNNLSVKRLQTPTCKEFLHIFNFLLELIDDSLPVNGMNIVEEVPLVLKLLGYPFTVSRNHLLNVGSPHSWPILLGAISWLLECCSVTDSTRQILFHRNAGFGDEDDEGNIVEAEFDYEEHMYSVYMVYGQDSAEYQGLGEERRRARRMEIEQFESSRRALVEENDELAKRIEDLSSSSIPVLQAEIMQNQGDEEGLREYLDSLHQEIVSVKTAMADSDAKTSATEMQIDASKEKVAELEEKIRVQPMSAADARELHESITTAESALDVKRAQNDEMTRRIAELQIQHSKTVKHISEQCQVFNGKLMKVSALLPDLASLSPLDYDTSKRADPEVLKCLMRDAKILRDQLQKLQRRVTSGMQECEGEVLSADSAQSSLHMELVKKELELDSLQRKLSVEKEALEKKRRLDEETLKSAHGEREALEHSYRALQQRLEAEPVNYLGLKKECKSEITEMTSRLDSDNEVLQDLIISLMKFIEAVNESQDEAQKQVDELLKKFKDLTIPTVHPDILNLSV